jgi:heavy metal sensor kinase
LIQLLLIAPFLLILGALGSYWLAGRAFIPVDRLIRITRIINAGDLRQRVPVPRAHDEIRLLALTFNEMIDRLNEAFTRQKRFVADASHELRTPVTAIRSMAEVALNQATTPGDYISVLHEVGAETERLGHLINDLLALARADEGRTLLDKQPVRLDLLAADVVATVEPLSVERGITLQVQAPEPITVLGDEARLIQVLMNLLDNAITYTDVGGQVTVTVESRHDNACLTVSDTGFGIAQEDIPRIFDRFYRADPARSRTTGGSGLGLAIVEWIVRAHGGTITVESQVGHGSTFTVTLPLAT